MVIRSRGLPSEVGGIAGLTVRRPTDAGGRACAGRLANEALLLRCPLPVVGRPPGLVEDAYRTVRRHNVGRYLLARLNRGGRGTRVEIHPLNQSQVPRPRQRELNYRSLNVRHWDAVIAAWTAQDDQAMDDAWVEKIVDLGSQWGQYYHVSNIGFAA